MGTKNNPASFDCYCNALPDEPMFILLARDPTAPDIVREWANGREDAIDAGYRPESDRAMVAEARECADAMIAWRAASEGAWRRSTTPESPMTLEDALIKLKEARAGYDSAHSEAVMSRRNETAALRHLNEAQRAVDAAIAGIKSDAPQDSDWHSVDRRHDARVST